MCRKATCGASMICLRFAYGSSQRVIEFSPRRDGRGICPSPRLHCQLTGQPRSCRSARLCPPLRGVERRMPSARGWQRPTGSQRRRPYRRDTSPPSRRGRRHRRRSRAPTPQSFQSAVADRRGFQSLSPARCRCGCGELVEVRAVATICLRNRSSFSSSRAIQAVTRASIDAKSPASSTCPGAAVITPRRQSEITVRGLSYAHSSRSTRRWRIRSIAVP